MLTHLVLLHTCAFSSLPYDYMGYKCQPHSTYTDISTVGQELTNLNTVFDSSRRGQKLHDTISRKVSRLVTRGRRIKDCSYWLPKAVINLHEQLAALRLALTTARFAILYGAYTEAWFRKTFPNSTSPNRSASASC